MKKVCGRCVYAFYEAEKHAIWSKCRLFGEKEKGKIVHAYSEECRKDETQCGKTGLYFRLKE